MGRRLLVVGPRPSPIPIPIPIPTSRPAPVGDARGVAWFAGRGVPDGIDGDGDRPAVARGDAGDIGIGYGIGIGIGPDPGSGSETGSPC